MNILHSIALDDETALRLAAVCEFLLTNDKKNVTPQAIVNNAVNQLHNSLLQARPQYVTFFENAKAASVDDDDDDENQKPPLLLTQFPVEFLKLETGVDSIFLKRRFRCQLCETAFSAPTLKTGSLVTKFDSRTQLEIYVGVRQDSTKEFIDFSLFNVLVCPACLYAALDKDFDVWATNQRNESDWIRRNKTKYPTKLKNAFQMFLPQRLEIAQTAGKKGMNLFSTVRTEKDASIAMTLAIGALQFLRKRSGQTREAEISYNIGIMALMKSLMFEKQLAQLRDENLRADLTQQRSRAVKEALDAFNSVPEQSAENFEMREVIRYYARRFWTAREMRDLAAFAASGAALQRINNQYVNLVKKMERDVATEDAKLKKLNEEIRKTTNPQKREGLEQQAKTIQGNIALMRNGLENGRNVLKVIVPVYDEISLDYDKFKEMQRAQRAAATQAE